MDARKMILREHSVGAEFAAGSALHVGIPDSRGVAAISPVSRGQLWITLSGMACR